ncbi:DUF3592 domain-containing protein [Streptomyces sp. MB22_4]|uniref:DUF3592 domain-containing protein n=1 Tax=Streptomyces sp. MB22_4 TaxID=3383120 RepID=UPI0039A2D93D
MVILPFLVLLVIGLFRAAVGTQKLMTQNTLRERGVRVEAEVIGPAPDSPHSRRRGSWVINPLVSWTTPDGQTVYQGVGSRRTPIRVREDAHVTLFHAQDDPQQLIVERPGALALVYTDIVLGVLLVVISVLLIVVNS